MKILGIERDKTACNHYRILQPLSKLYEHELADVLTMYERDFANMDYAMERIMPADIIVFQRPADENWLQLIKSVQKMGKFVVVDYDDDPFTTSPLSPAYRFLGTEEAVMQWPDGTVDELWKNGESGFNIEANIKYRNLFKFNFKKADLVTSTTDILARNFSKINKNSVVLPNLIDLSMYPKCEFVKKEVRIGWQGGSSHYEDLYLITPVLKDILDNHDNVKFVYAGDMRFVGLFKGLDQNKIEYHPWVQHVAYPFMLATLNLDIGICPLVDNTFNRNKSAIKYMEYTAVGATTWASDIPPYSEVIKNGETGVLSSYDYTQMKESMVNLIVDSELRKRLAKKAYEDVIENYNADTKAHLWLDAYSKAIEAPLEV